MELLLLFPILLLVPYILFFLYPVRVERISKNFKDLNLLPPKAVFLYSYEFHIHTQFSYDSLGKPEDLFKARDEAQIDYLIVTDHEVDYFKHFADDRTIVGIERKINDEHGRLLGDVIEVSDLKVISHHFRKYRWKLPRKTEYLFELINLKDALVHKKGRLFLYLLFAPFLYPVAKNYYLKNFTKVIKPEEFAEKYLEEEWENKLVCGLDHHVKVYVREVGIRFLFPSYRFSFMLMRGFVLSRRKLNTKDEFLQAFREFPHVTSFSDKPTIFWKEGNTLLYYAPYRNVLTLLLRKGEKRAYVGSNGRIELGEGVYILVGYTYLFRLGNIFFGVKPLFLSDIIKI